MADQAQLEQMVAMLLDLLQQQGATGGSEGTAATQQALNTALQAQMGAVPPAGPPAPTTEDMMMRAAQDYQAGMDSAGLASPTGMTPEQIAVLQRLMGGR